MVEIEAGCVALQLLLVHQRLVGCRKHTTLVAAQVPLHILGPAAAALVGTQVLAAPAILGLELLVRVAEVEVVALVRQIWALVAAASVFLVKGQTVPLLAAAAHAVLVVREALTPPAAVLAVHLVAVAVAHRVGGVAPLPEETAQ